MISAAYAGKVNSRFGQLHIQILECACNDPGYRQIPEPFVVRRDDEPRSELSTGPMEHIFERSHVIFPVLPLQVVGFADLPVPGWIIQSSLESGQLLILRYMEEELENRC